MPILSHLHQLFDVDACCAYIHRLRWKDRPLQCPRCQSHKVGPWGTYHYQPGLKRYRCKEKGCTRTFNDLTGSLLDGSKRSMMHWIVATFLLCLSCSSRRIARELGVHIRTSLPLVLVAAQREIAKLWGDSVMLGDNYRIGGTHYRVAWA